MINNGSSDNSITINVRNLSKRFNQEWIFRNLSYNFKAGNTYAITGPNGSGKSTLLHMLWGQVPPTSGEIQYLTADEKTIAADDIYRHISLAAPYQDLIDEFTLTEQLEFHFRLKIMRVGLTISELLNIMYLEQAKDKFIGNFSSGMKQRVKLALAFYTNASLIFLDEPCTNLDQQASDWYRNQLSALPNQCTIFIASNNSSEYPATATKINVQDYKNVKKNDLSGS